MDSCLSDRMEPPRCSGVLLSDSSAGTESREREWMIALRPRISSSFCSSSLDLDRDMDARSPFRVGLALLAAGACAFSLSRRSSDLVRSTSPRKNSTSPRASASPRLASSSPSSSSWTSSSSCFSCAATVSTSAVRSCRSWISCINSSMRFSYTLSVSVLAISRVSIVLRKSARWASNSVVSMAIFSFFSLSSARSCRASLSSVPARPAGTSEFSIRPCSSVRLLSISASVAAWSLSWRLRSSSWVFSFSTSSSLTRLPVREAARELGRAFMANEETEPMLPPLVVLVRRGPTGVVSSSSVYADDAVVFPRAEALRGPMLPFRSRAGSLLLGSPAVPRTLCANLLVAFGLPNRVGPVGPLEALGPGVAMDCRGGAASCSFRTGDSGRGSEARGGRFPMGLAARPGPPTDWLNLGMEGVGGVKFVEFWFATFNPPGVVAVGVMGKGLVAVACFTALDRGRKMPAPGCMVVK